MSETATPAAPAATGSSFYLAMRILPQERREAMYAVYAFCRAVDDIADGGWAAASTRCADLERWRADIDALFAGRAPARPRRSRRGRAPLRPEARGLRRGHRRHGDGRGGRHPGARLGDARPLLRPGRERRRTAVGAHLRHGEREPARRSPIISAAPCNSPTSCATSTRTPRSAGSTCRAKRWPRPGIASTIRSRSRPIRSLPRACDEVAARARSHFAQSGAIMAGEPAARRARAAADGRGLSIDPRPYDRARLRAAAPADRRPTVCAFSARFCDTPSYERRDRPRRRGRRRGLERRGAPRRRRRRVVAPRGRRRGRRPLPILSRSGARPDDRQRQPSAAVGQPRGARLSRPHRLARQAARPAARAIFDFADLAERRTLAAASQRRPAAVVAPRSAGAACPARRCTNISRRSDAAGRRPRRRSARSMTCSGPLYDRLWGPVLLAGLNTDPPEGSARLAGGDAARDACGRAARPAVRWSRSRACRACFVEPALASSSRAARRSASATRLRGVEFAAGRAVALDFGADRTRRWRATTRSSSPCRPARRASFFPISTRPTNSARSSTRISASRRRRDQPRILGVVNGLSAMDLRLSRSRCR